VTHKGCEGFYYTIDLMIDPARAHAYNDIVSKKECIMDLSFLPSIINDDPTRKYMREISTQKIKFMKVAMKVATNIHIRCRLSEAQNWKCCWCGTQCVPESNQSNSATIEHIQPRSLGGADDQENYAMSCSRCNNKRGTLSVEDFMNNKFASTAGRGIRTAETKLAKHIRSGVKLAKRGWITENGEPLCVERWIFSLHLTDEHEERLRKGVFG
jgi:hypothetical protein